MEIPGADISANTSIER